MLVGGLVLALAGILIILLTTLNTFGYLLLVVGVIVALVGVVQTYSGRGGRGSGSI